MPIAYGSFLSLIVCPENLSWQLSGWGPTKDGQAEMWVAARVLPSIDNFRELLKSFFWLSSGKALCN